VTNDEGELSSMTKDNLHKFSHNLSGDLKVSSDIAMLTSGCHRARLYARHAKAPRIHQATAVVARHVRKELGF
jgi:hypothetical protein